MEELFMYAKVYAILVAILILAALIVYIIEKCYSISMLRDEKLAYEMIQQEEELAIKIKKEELSEIKRANTINSRPSSRRTL